MTSGLVFALAGVALFAMGAAGVLLLAELMRRVLAFNIMAVSYTHLTLPTNREV